MSVSSIVTRGYSNGTFTGSIAYAVTAGYDIAEALNLVGYLNGEITIFSAYNGIVLTQSALTGSVTAFNALDLD
jgi:hypothetical protein